jgi:myo-inositol-1(or 4)-monophosphatase
VTELSDLLAFAESTARQAGDEIKRARTHGWTSEMKGGLEIVTSADLAADTLIRKAVAHRTPSAQVLSEEGERETIDWSKPVWVIDPIDGTVNYAYGHEYVSVCIAYVEKGEVQASVVHSPFQEETFTALRDHGAWLNGEAIRPRKTESLRLSLIATGFPYGKDEIEPILQRFCRMMRSCRDVRRLASAALDICWVACGRLDACYETVRPWDIAAAGLVAREAGVRRGHFTDVETDLPPELCGLDYLFATEDIFDAFLAVLQGTAPPARRPPG